jgi:AGCS family alanine or glycine:cation symporter
VLMVFLGSVGSLSIVWDFADLANGFMVLPNIISLIFLHKVVVGETQKYLWSHNLDAIDK